MELEATTKKGKKHAHGTQMSKGSLLFNWTYLEIAPVSILAKKLDTARAFPRLRTCPRDGHQPHADALRSGEFPVKPIAAEWGGVDFFSSQAAADL